MRVYRSNRMEALSGALAEVLRTPCEGATPLETMSQREVVVVHSQGMARWLSMELARHLGVCANIEFPFPKAMVRQSVGAVLGEQEDAWKVWRPDAMLWSTLSALSGLLDAPSFSPLATYLSQRSASSRPQDALGHVDAVLLVREIADIFDRYISYRPDLIAAWERGEGDADDWQPALWQAIRARVATPHLGALVGQLEGALRRRVEVSPERLPKRICLFGISTLPPFYLDLFSALGQIRDIHLFILCPSNVYWGDIRSKREQARELRRLERTQGTPADLGELHLDEGNPLLASFGRLGRDFQVVLEDRDAAMAYHDTGDDLFVDPMGEAPSLLHVLQSDILNVQKRGLGADDAPIRVADDDTSVRVHACYGAMRQVEALRDDLLDRFAADPTLEPRDIVVMTPDVERFAPIVEAIFGDKGADPEIPYRIADRTVAKENPIAEVIDRAMNLTTQRLTGPELLDLFALPPVQRRFGLHDDDMDTLKEWIQTTGIRWGIDAADRERHDQPGYTLNTWRFGLNRMLLGTAMPGQERDTFEGVLPYDEIEGGDATLLGRLAEACDVLFTTLHDLTEPRPMAAWVEALKSTIERLADVLDQDAWRIQQVHAVLDDLLAETASAEYDADLDRGAIHALLKRRLESPGRAAGFLTGSVTICAMVPMRSVPFRVVALLGMDEANYPRKGRNMGFDLTARHPRIGDRSPREEDRYLMLEALLAARDALVVTYTGHNPHTGEEAAPAAPIDELLEVIASSAGLSETLAPVVIHHPLHPFSPSLFGIASGFDATGNPTRHAVAPRSHDARRLEAAARMLRNPSEVPPLVRGSVALKADTGQPLEVSLSELIDFFKSPSKGFLYRRLGVFLDDRGDALEDREPTHIERGLGQWSVLNSALQQTLAGDSTEDVYERMRLSGTLPLGVPGRIAFDQATAPLNAIVTAHDSLVSGEARSLPVDVQLGKTRLVGQVDHIYPGGRVIAHPSGSSAKHEIGLWLPHLVRRAIDPDPPAASMLIRKRGVDAEVLRLGTALTSQEARRLLEAIVEDYWLGQQAPLCFFPETSQAYVSALPLYKADKHTNVATPEAYAVTRAALAWTKSGQPGAEAKDTYNVTLHGQGEPFRPGYSMPGIPRDIAPLFASIAARFWGPFLKERDEEEGP
jgi:exodeoxyribonuclease V gamma subunit